MGISFQAHGRAVFNHPYVAAKFKAGALRLSLASMTLLFVQPLLAGPEETLRFAKECTRGKRLTIAAVGDLLFNGGLQRYALSSSGSYRALWSSVEVITNQADLAYGNLEGPVANGVTYDGRVVADPGHDWRNPVYEAPRTHFSFNYHPSLIGDLKRSGFALVSTANNHALDRGPVGIERTIDNIESNGLSFVGTRKRSELARPWSTVIRTNGFTLAWIACTYGLNGRPDIGGQVLLCYEQQKFVLDEIHRQSADPTIDAIVLAPHWGTELSPIVEQRQRDLANEAVSAGALLVIGSHPHIVQEWEKLQGPDKREALVIYSSGDFISRELADPDRFGIISLIELWKGPQPSKAHIAAAGYTATQLDLTAAPQLRELPAGREILQLPRGNRIPLSLDTSVAQALRVA